jgi:hypothetical protein
VTFTLFDSLIKKKEDEIASETLNQIKPNLAGMVIGWVPFKIVSDRPALHSRWLLLLKIKISLVVNFCFITRAELKTNKTKNTVFS